MITFAAIMTLACALIAACAARFSGNRDVRSYLVAVLAVWLVASVLLSASSASTLRSAIATSLWCLTIAAIYAAVPEFSLHRANLLQISGSVRFWPLLFRFRCLSTPRSTSAAT